MDGDDTGSLGIVRAEDPLSCGPAIPARAGQSVGHLAGEFVMHLNAESSGDLFGLETLSDLAAEGAEADEGFNLHDGSGFDDG